MQGDHILRTVIRGIWVLACISASLWATAQDGSYAQLLVQANRAFAGKQYESAINGYQQVLRDYPDGDMADQTLFCLAQCYQAMSKEQEATSTLIQLTTRYPTSPYAPDGFVLLYRAHLAANQTAQADLVWSDVAKRWPESFQMWQIITHYYQDVAKQHPERAADKVQAISTLQFKAENLSLAVYQPLFQAGRFAEVQLIHHRLLEVLQTGTGAAQRLIEARNGYLQSISQHAISILFQHFSAAMEAGNREEARKWLIHLNTIAPEHPRAQQARSTFHAAEEKAGKK